MRGFNGGVALALLLAACGGAGEGAATRPANSGATPAAVEAEGSQEAAATAIDACALLTEAEVASEAGGSVKKVEAGTDLGEVVTVTVGGEEVSEDEAPNCQWTMEGEIESTLTVRVDPAGGRGSFEWGLKDYTGKMMDDATPTKGIGDDAYFKRVATSSVSLEILHGEAHVALQWVEGFNSVEVDDDEAFLKALGKKVLDRL